MEYYIYLHRKKSDNSIFYVGKGSGVRAWDLIKRNSLWQKVANKYGVVVEIYKKGLQEWYAYEIEKDLILQYGKIANKTGVLANITDGGDGAGSGCPCWKKDLAVRDYYNPKTNEFFSGTRDEFKEKFFRLVLFIVFFVPFYKTGYSFRNICFRFIIKIGN